MVKLGWLLYRWLVGMNIYTVYIYYLYNMHVCVYTVYVYICICIYLNDNPVVNILYIYVNMYIS